MPLIHQGEEELSQGHHRQVVLPTHHKQQMAHTHHQEDKGLIQIQVDSLQGHLRHREATCIPRWEEGRHHTPQGVLLVTLLPQWVDLGIPLLLVAMLRTLLRKGGVGVIPQPWEATVDTHQLREVLLAIPRLLGAVLVTLHHQ